MSKVSLSVPAASAPLPRALEVLGAWADLESEMIFRWWADHMVDGDGGGFWGEIDEQGQPVEYSPKGVILNARLLWYFSEAALHFGTSHKFAAEARALADRAFESLAATFLDPVRGGLYWLANANGERIDAKKQAYAQAFGIYALSAYFRLTKGHDALGLARCLLCELEARYWDQERGGYIEALSEDWSEVRDQRLSDKDADCPKTMNTHLHILEAYTGLHLAAPDRASEAALRRAISVFLEHFIDWDTGHLNLFFDMDWTNRTQTVSFGHDVEASWLVWEAAIALRDMSIIEAIKNIALKLAEVTLNEGTRADGGLMNERGHDGNIDSYGEWWGQAEAMVGFLNAYELDPRPEYLAAIERLISYISLEHKSDVGSEWSWYPKSSGDQAPYLAGLWKCPYHNGRAMFEIQDRLGRFSQRHVS